MAVLLTFSGGAGAATLQYQIIANEGLSQQVIEDEIPLGGGFSTSLTNGGSTGWFSIQPGRARVRANANPVGSGDNRGGGAGVSVTINDTIVITPPAGSGLALASLTAMIGVSGSLAQSGGAASWIATTQLTSDLYRNLSLGFVQPLISARASGGVTAAFGASGSSLPATLTTSVPAQFTNATDVFPLDTPIFLTFGFGVSASAGNSSGSFARANLEDTILWLGITARDAEGNVIEGLTFTSDSGIDWGNPPAVIPLPAAGWLLLAGLGVLGGLAGGRRS